MLQGITGVHAAACGSDPAPTLAKLWLHEVMRVFHDRLVDTGDQELVKTTAHALLSSRFGCMDSYASLFEEGLPVLFADCAKPGLSMQERTYEQVTGVACIPMKLYVAAARLLAMQEVALGWTFRPPAMQTPSAWSSLWSTFWRASTRALARLQE